MGDRCAKRKMEAAEGEVARTDRGAPSPWGAAAGHRRPEPAGQGQGAGPVGRVTANRTAPGSSLFSFIYFFKMYLFFSINGFPTINFSTGTEARPRLP